MDVSRTSRLASTILLGLYLVTGLIPNLKAIDVLAPQWVYLAGLNLLNCIYFLFTEKNNDNYKKLFGTTYFKIYLFLAFWVLGSYFYSINKAVALFELPRFLNIFFAITFSFFHFNKLKNKFNTASIFLVSYLILNIIFYYDDFIGGINSNTLNPLLLKGISANKNIGAASLAILIPFSFHWILKSKNIMVKILLLIIVTLAYLLLSYIVARAAILSSSLVALFYIVYFIYDYVKNKKEGHFTLGRIGLIVIPIVIAISINLFISKQNEAKINKDIIETYGSIGFSDESSNGRFAYWNDTYRFFQDHPVIGCGIGNWKLSSINYGKAHVKGYTVPYHAHNDFLQTLTELGIIGFLCYLGIFLTLAYYVLKLFFKQKRKKLIYVTLLMGLMAYSLDAALNFPMARPFIQSLLVLIAGAILSVYVEKTENKTKEKSNSVVLAKSILGVSFLTLVGCLIVTLITYKSLKEQGGLLWEFNRGEYNISLDKLENINDNYPNITETAMPIKTMKARYFFKHGQIDKAIEYAHQGIKDNPYIYYSENLLSSIYFQQKQYDSAYHYSKIAFENLPKNKPHYSSYLRVLTIRKDRKTMDEVFDIERKLYPNDPQIWIFYLRSVAQFSHLNDEDLIQKATEAKQLFPNNKDIDLIYRIVKIGQQRVEKGKKLAEEAKTLYSEKSFSKAGFKYYEAYQQDPLVPKVALNGGLAFYQAKNYPNAIQFLTQALSTSKDPKLINRAKRFLALSYYFSGDSANACVYFKELSQTNVRMNIQEFNKYCK